MYWGGVMSSRSFTSSSARSLVPSVGAARASRSIWRDAASARRLLPWPRLTQKVPLSPSMKRRPSTSMTWMPRPSVRISGFSANSFIGRKSTMMWRASSFIASPCERPGLGRRRAPGATHGPIVPAGLAVAKGTGRRAPARARGGRGRAARPCGRVNPTLAGRAEGRARTPGPSRARRNDHGGGGDRLDGADPHRQGVPGRVQQHPRGHPGRPRHRARRPARAAGPGRGRGRHHRVRHARGRDRPQHRAPGRAPRRAARHRRRHDRQPLLLLGPPGDRDRGPAGDRGPRAGRRGGRRRGRSASCRTST